jgi:hypothetical protein
VELGLILVDPLVAAVLLADPRLTDQIGFLESRYAVTCSLPDSEHLEAEVRCVGSGDFASCFYTFTVPCGGGEPQEMRVVSERTQLGPLLNLSLTVNFRR